MTRYKAPMRVFAVLRSDPMSVDFLGFGTYVGDHYRPGTEGGFSEEEYEEVEAVIQEQDEDPPIDPVKAIQWEIDNGHTEPDQFEQRLAEVKRSQQERRSRPLRERAHEILTKMAKNPKIELDNSDIVWGYQCWWGPEERFETWLDNRKINRVRIGEYV